MSSGQEAGPALPTTTTPKVFHVAGFVFTTDFDSGNLGRVELAPPGDGSGCSNAADNLDVRSSVVAHVDNNSLSLAAGGQSSTASAIEFLSRPSTMQPRSVGADMCDVDFRLWTRPDCQNTEFENGNRTWFYFGLRGGSPGCVVKFTLMNLNKQAKLFSQGMAPVFLAPGKTQWERVRDPPTYQSIDSNFVMSFKFRTYDSGTTYFAFTYPYTYRELQASLDKLTRRYSNGGRSYDHLRSLPDTAIYFHRENATYSLEGRRLDLLTITGLNGLTAEREAVLANLFPPRTPSSGSSLPASAPPRPLLFRGKKTVFLSARVHPGETCSSFVMNGLIRFLLKEADPRATALRRKYVFKLIPMLNPDGVVNGHYRTDTRGVNLNRVYGNTSHTLHPTIYAARKLILYAHVRRDIESSTFVAEETSSPQTEDASSPVKKSELISVLRGEDNVDAKLASTCVGGAHQGGHHSETLQHTSTADVGLAGGVGSSGGVANNLRRSSENEFFWEIPQPVGSGARCRMSSSRSSNSSRGSFSGFPPASSFSTSSPLKHHQQQEYSAQWYEMTENSRCSEGDESIADFSLLPTTGVPAGEHNQPQLLHNTSLAATLSDLDGGGRIDDGEDAAGFDFIVPGDRRCGGLVTNCSSSSGLGTQLQHRTSFLGALNKSGTHDQPQQVASGANRLEPAPTETTTTTTTTAKQLNQRRHSESFFVNLKDTTDEDRRTIDSQSTEGPGGVLGPADEDITSASDMMMSGASLVDPRPTYPADNGESGLYMYIDVHGHASKRGIFMYGNHFHNTETKIDALLFPKLMAYNNANFDFPACNFTQRNMFLKDRHTGAGREGSGRVSIYRATGLTYCYTLECNFNTGRVTNIIPAASRDLGRATPPPIYDIPPKYGPTIYEETGKALGVSMLDLSEANPWTRLTCSNCKNLSGVRSWVRTYLKSAESGPSATSSSGKATTRSNSASAANNSVKSSPMRTRLQRLSGVKKSVIRQLKISSAGGGKSPGSPDSPLLASSSAIGQRLSQPSLSKISRKALSTKNSQSSVPGKLSRHQLSLASSTSSLKGSSDSVLFVGSSSSAGGRSHHPHQSGGKVRPATAKVRSGSAGSSHSSCSTASGVGGKLMKRVKKKRPGSLSAKTTGIAGGHASSRGSSKPGSRATSPRRSSAAAAAVKMAAVDAGSSSVKLSAAVGLGTPVKTVVKKKKKKQKLCSPSPGLGRKKVGGVANRGSWGSESSAALGSSPPPSAQSTPALKNKKKKKRAASGVGGGFKAM